MAEGSTWNHLHVKDVVIWKMSIPDDDELVEKLKNIKLDGNNTEVQKMNPSFPLSHYYSGGDDLAVGSVHVLAQLPVDSEMYPSL